MNRFDTASGIKANRLARLGSSRALLLFLNEVLLRPSSAGAILPSSRSLAKRIARMVPAQGAGLVVELGAGTGAVTQALLDHGIQADRLLVVERSASLAEHLASRFPRLRVIHGDAGKLGDFLPPGALIDAVVSGVPLRSLPYAESRAIVQHWRAVLPNGALIVQFTYALYGPLRHLTDGFTQLASEIIWLNFPAARVVALQLSRATSHGAGRKGGRSDGQARGNLAQAGRLPAADERQRLSVDRHGG
ncbi:methyltransferase [Burkholderia sp. WAC0059]|uniref:class I SAM-dependent methyltransferase n=1 Tax=Burkholderia sp. WAC0059 TaxID=2066022 RepID=UPI000C7EC294|nr:methyltransferase domain-containing protein [Burkholderia sp. WAC0059]PLZ03555.1 methyltransferase [Burkholderia sp. WAC0059]